MRESWETEEQYQRRIRPSKENMVHGGAVLMGTLAASAGVGVTRLVSRLPRFIQFPLITFTTVVALLNVKDYKGSEFEYWRIPAIFLLLLGGIYFLRAKLKPYLFERAKRKGWRGWLCFFLYDPLPIMKGVRGLAYMAFLIFTVASIGSLWVQYLVLDIEQFLDIFQPIGHVPALLILVALAGWLFSALTKWRKRPSKKQAAALRSAPVQRRQNEIIDEPARTVAAGQQAGGQLYRKPVIVTYTIKPN